MTVMTISVAKSNAHLIAEAEALGYIDGRVLDLTLGSCAGFWKVHMPDDLTTNDLDPEVAADHHYDFRATPFTAGSFDTVVLDGPYKLNGRGGSHPSDARYGVDGSGVSWQDRMQLNRDGITEAIRLSRQWVLVKCQDQVCSGQVRWQTIDFTNHAVSLGCRLIDMLHLQSHRPQPEGRRQVHSRRNYSTLLVLRKEVAS